MRRFLATAVGRPWFWVLFVGVGLSLPALRALTTPAKPPLPVLARVPPFRLVDQTGQPLSSDALAGRVWVANFIFTRCPSICPLFTRKMAKIQDGVRELGNAIHLVSFTVDPEYDTPPVLTEYAKEHKASPRLWSFLTGDRAELQKTVVDGLHVHMSKEGDDLMSIGHGGHFVLVDANMQVRGYYDSGEADAVDRILRDAGRLMQLGN